MKCLQPKVIYRNTVKQGKCETCKSFRDDIPCELKNSIKDIENEFYKVKISVEKCPLYVESRRIDAPCEKQPMRL